MLLVAGVTTWLVWPPDRSPFEQAVANLAAQPIADYRSDLPDGSQFDGRVTNEGDAAGWLMTSSVTQIKFQFLLVNGKLFVKLNGDLLPPGTARDAFNDAGLKNRWITGDVGELKPLVKQSVTPAAIAGKLRDEVARTEKLPPPSDDGVTIDGVPVLKGDTPDGILYVAKEQPYRVIRWVDKQTKKAASAFTNPGGKLLLNGERAGYTGLGTADFTPMNADNNDQLYDEMQTDVGQLGDAIDTSVRYTVSSVDNLEHFDDCQAAGCQVVAHFTTTTARRVAAGRDRADVGQRHHRRHRRRLVQRHDQGGHHRHGHHAVPGQGHARRLHAGRRQGRGRRQGQVRRQRLLLLVPPGPGQGARPGAGPGGPRGRGQAAGVAPSGPRLRLDGEGRQRSHAREPVRQAHGPPGHRRFPTSRSTSSRAGRPTATSGPAAGSARTARPRRPTRRPSSSRCSRTPRWRSSRPPARSRTATPPRATSGSGRPRSVRPQPLAP